MMSAFIVQVRAIMLHTHRAERDMCARQVLGRDLYALSSLGVRTDLATMLLEPIA